MIKSDLNNLVLDIQGNNPAPGTKVATWDKTGSDNQLWYEHDGSCTIRSKLHDMCLEVTADGLVVNPHQPKNNNQKLKFTDTRIHVCCNPGQVLDIAASKKDKGAKVVGYKQGGQQPNQKWKLEYVDSGSGAGAAGPQHRKFFLQNDLYQRVLDVAGGNTQPGAQVVMHSRKKGKERTNQLWYMDNNGVIHSALNDLVLDTSGGPGNPVKMQRYLPGNKHHQWTVKGKLIVNNNFPRQFPDVKPGATPDGAPVVVKKDEAAHAQQQWRADFV